MASLSGGFAAARADDFNMPKVNITGLKALQVQISEYHVVFPRPGAAPGSMVELLGPRDRPLGVRLSRDDFCAAALQGTVEIAGVRYSVFGKGKKSLVNCALPRYGCPRCGAYALGQNRFVRQRAALSGKTYGLVPYRTVAVALNGLPFGTVLFIPAARGLRMPDGKRHDGYFFVADIGAMRSSQLDLYAGTQRLTWWIIGSGTARSRTSTAYIVTDPAVVAWLKVQHLAAAARE